MDQGQSTSQNTTSKYTESNCIRVDVNTKARDGYLLEHLMLVGYTVIGLTNWSKLMGCFREAVRQCQPSGLTSIILPIAVES